MSRVLLLPLLVLALWFACARAQRRQHSFVTEREVKKRTVDVEGTAAVNLVPDVAFVTLKLETLDKSASTAFTLHNKRMNAVLAELSSTRVGLPAKDLSTSQFALRPEYTYIDSKNTFVGMKASQALLVKVKDTAKVSAVLDAALSSSQSKIQIDSVQFTVENKAKSTVEVRARAIKDATDKARQICAATGMRLGPPISIHEDEGSLSNSAGTPQFKYARASAVGGGGNDDASGGAALPKGELQLQHHVSITF